MLSTVQNGNPTVQFLYSPVSAPLTPAGARVTVVEEWKLNPQEIWLLKCDIDRGRFFVCTKPAGN